MTEYLTGIIVVSCITYVLIKIFPFLIKGVIWGIGLIGILIIFITIFLYIDLPK